MSAITDLVTVRGGDGYTQEPSIRCQFDFFPLPDIAGGRWNLERGLIPRVVAKKSRFSLGQAEAVCEAFPQN